VFLQVEYAPGDDDEEEEEDEEEEDCDDEEEEEEEEDDEDYDYEHGFNNAGEDEEQWDRDWGTGWSGDSRNSHESSNVGRNGVDPSASPDSSVASDKVCFSLASEALFLTASTAALVSAAAADRDPQSQHRFAPGLIYETSNSLHSAAKAKAMHSQFEAAHMKSSSALASAAAMAQHAQTNLQNIQQQHQQYSGSLASSSSTATSQVRCRIQVQCT
jgi:hypothetical protein